MITQNQINQVVETIVKNIQPEKVILFGSYANGNPNEDSDLDLLIIKDMPEKRSRRGREYENTLEVLKSRLIFWFTRPRRLNYEAWRFSLLQGQRVRF